MKIRLRRPKLKIQLANKIILLSIFPLTLLMKIVQYNFLPAKFFYDSRHILQIMTAGNLSFKAADSYNNTALVFSKINIFNAESLLGWSIAISIVADCYLLLFLSGKSCCTLRERISLFCMLGLLNIFVFNLSKEIIQFFIFALIGFCIQSYIIENYYLKIGIIAGIFILESYLYRSYYILIAVFFGAAAVVMPKILEHFKTDRRKIRKFLFLAGCIFMSLSVFLFVCQYIKPEEYAELMAIRSNLTFGRIGEADAQTLIVNMMESGSHVILIFVLNYFINAVRMLFPFELLSKGLYYYPFFVFQIICSWNIIKRLVSFGNLNLKERLNFYVICAYYLTAFFFEPDFGSFVRHEVATFPVLFTLISGRHITRWKLLSKSNIRSK